MGASMFIDKVRFCGVQFTSDKLPKIPNFIIFNNTISHYVIKQALASHSKAIEESEQYQNFRFGRTTRWVGPGPHDTNGSYIHAYLWGHSVRSGCKGKLAGVVYRIMEFTNEFLWGASDKLKALDEIEDLLVQKQKLTNKTYRGGAFDGIMPVGRKIPEAIHREAELILKDMLFQYNLFVDK